MQSQWLAVSGSTQVPGVGVKEQFALWSGACGQIAMPPMATPLGVSAIVWSYYLIYLHSQGTFSHLTGYGLTDTYSSLFKRN